MTPHMAFLSSVHDKLLELREPSLDSSIRDQLGPLPPVLTPEDFVGYVTGVEIRSLSPLCPFAKLEEWHEHLYGGEHSVESAGRPDWNYDTPVTPRVICDQILRMKMYLPDYHGGQP